MGAVGMIEAQIRTFPDRDALNQALADVIAKDLKRAIEHRGKASVAFSGGSTPAPMLEKLSEYALDWSSTYATLVDERWVNLNHPDSNEAQLRRSLQRGSARAINLTGLKTEHSKPEQAIDDLDKTLDLLTWPLDCVHLGMGTDGHTASWFSDAPEYAQAINQRHRHRVIALNPKAASHPRMSLTASAILAARSRYIHITGEEKRSVLERALKGEKSLPISIVLSHPSPPTIYWAP